MMPARPLRFTFLTGFAWLVGFGVREAQAAFPIATLGDLGWSGLHISELVQGAAMATHSCLTEFSSFWWGGPPSSIGGGGGGSLVLDIVFLALLVIAVIAVVRVRQRTELTRLELARRYIEQGIEPPPELFPSAARNDLRRGIVLVFTGLGLVGASLATSGWAQGLQGLGPAGLIPGFIGLGYLVSYACAARGKKAP